MIAAIHVSGPKKRATLVVCWGFVGDEILPSHMGMIINHYKDPY